jgi:hypothetical protein
MLAHNQPSLSISALLYVQTKPNRDAPAVSSSSAPPAETVVESSQAQSAGWTNAIPAKPGLAYTLELTEDPNVVEKVKIEETKAQLAKAREGMERQAAAAAAAPAAAAGLPKPLGGASRWVGARGGMRGTASHALDVGNAQLFPDLAAAEKIVTAAQAAPARPKPKLAARPNKKKPAKPPMVKPTLEGDGNSNTNDTTKEAAEAAVPPPTAAAIVAGTATAATTEVPKVIKKNKRDVSSFGK